MKIIIETIDHCSQRDPDAIGDWHIEKDNCIVVRVSKMDDPISELAVAIHELQEAFLCWRKGVSEEEVNLFDFRWAENFKNKLTQSDEPGGEPDAPYHWEHQASNQTENTFVLSCGMSLKEHDRNCENPI